MKNTNLITCVRSPLRYFLIIQFYIQFWKSLEYRQKTSPLTTFIFLIWRPKSSNRIITLFDKSLKTSLKLPRLSKYFLYETRANFFNYSNNHNCSKKLYTGKLFYIKGQLTNHLFELSFNFMRRLFFITLLSNLNSLNYVLVFKNFKYLNFPNTVKKNFTFFKSVLTKKLTNHHEVLLFNSSINNF